MRWFIGVCCLIAGVVGGFFLKQLMNKDAYTLDYKRIVLNLPISYSKSLSEPFYPLGEKYLAEDMAAAFQKLGMDARLYAIEDTYSNRDFRAGYEFYLRAFPELQLSSYHHYFDKDKISVLYETIPYKLDEVKNADVIFTGSLKKNRQYQKMGLNSFFIPQFTRLDKFYPAFDERVKSKVLFIGNRRGDLVKDMRKSIAYALENDIELTVYGSGWGDVFQGDKARFYAGQQIAADKLRLYYSSADIVLNDTRDDMIEAGFISNRIFDVTACGGFVISDYVPEIEEVYGDAVPMYKNSQEFKALIEYYLAHPLERREKALRAQKITMERFGAEVVMKQMLQILEDYRLKRGL